ncbi:hypothetical protein BT69DRAFT_1276021 [Atractiella rhizophila]|nr:hypothetical protein BT69DRAFT_1276021 [Atractiella rhizophila]
MLGPISIPLPMKMMRQKLAPPRPERRKRISTPVLLMRSSALIPPRILHESHRTCVAPPLPTTIYLRPPLTSNVSTKAEKMDPLLLLRTIPRPQTRTRRFSPPLHLGRPIGSVRGRGGRIVRT